VEGAEALRRIVATYAPKWRSGLSEAQHAKVFRSLRWSGVHPEKPSDRFNVSLSLELSSLLKCHICSFFKDIVILVLYPEPRIFILILVESTPPPYLSEGAGD
jgi:hypothetical protein